MQIAAESPAQHGAVHALLAAAFPTTAEAGLVARLRTRARPLVALVAMDAAQITGYVLFSPVRLDSAPHLALLGLAPLAVAPGHQGKGIGAALARAGLDACRQLGTGAVCVLGAPDYYSRFGFGPAHRFGIRSTYPVPDTAFMLLELQAGYLAQHSGCLHYHEEFDRL